MALGLRPPTGRRLKIILAGDRVGVQGHVWTFKALPIRHFPERLSEGPTSGYTPTLPPSDFMASGFRPLRPDSQSFTHHGKAGEDPKQIESGWADDLDRFRAMRDKYLLYH